MDSQGLPAAQEPAVMGMIGEESDLLSTLAMLVLSAGAAVMNIFVAGPNVRLKPDESPVCEADEAAEVLIVSGLAARFPDIPVVAEEAASKGAAPLCAGAFFLVDPLDGTREFVRLNGDFTVNVALVIDGEPRAGAVYAPMTRRLWLGSTLRAGAPFAVVGDVPPGAPAPPLATLTPIHARPRPAAGLVALVSRSHAESGATGFLDKLDVAERRAMGSSLKFCLIAEGDADVYPRFGPTMEWDTAAGDAVLRAAGGLVVDEAEKPLRYGKTGGGYRNPAFVAWGAPAVRGA